MPGPGRPFRKGEGGRPKGSKNKVTKAIAQRIIATRKPPLELMLDVMDFYYRRWLEAEDGADKRFCAELALQAARLAAPYCHPRKLVIEDDAPVTVTVIDGREPVNGHGNGPNSNGEKLN